MKIHIFATITFLLLYAAHVKAQQNEYSDKVYLNNGSILLGKIIYYQPKDTVRIQLPSGQTIVFTAKQVSKVKMYTGEEMKETKPSRAEKPYNFEEHGFYDALSMSLNFGRTYSPNVGIGAQNVVGYQYNRHIGGGIGIGYDSYYLTTGESNVASIFGEFRGYLNQHNKAEYWTLAAGYGQPLFNKNDVLSNLKGSFMVQPTIGLRFGASSRYNFFLDLGFRVQQVRYENNQSWAENRYTVTYRRWILRGGILF